MPILTRHLALAWREIIWFRPLTSQGALARFRALADDPTAPTIVFEVRSRGQQVRFLLGMEPAKITHTVQLLGVTALAINPDSMQIKVIPISFSLISHIITNIIDPSVMDKKRFDSREMPCDLSTMSIVKSCAYFFLPAYN